MIRLLTFFLIASTCSGATARELLEKIKAATGQTVGAGTVDTIKAGDPETQVTGIATTFMDTMDVLQRAAAAGKNLIITHEPTFYNHLDKTDDFVNDPVYLAKAKFIQDHHMVVFRFHDLWHKRRPDGILAGMVTALNWGKYQSAENPQRFTMPAVTLEEFAADTRDRLHIRTMRIIGNPDLQVRRIALLPGAAGTPAQLSAFREPDTDVLVIGETREWETVPYVQDAVAQGMKKALIILGHVPSEEQGMNECARWIKTFIKDVPVEFIPATEAFTAPVRRSLEERMKSLVEEKVVPGMVTVVADEKSIGPAQAFGFADAAMTKPMPANGMFWIASMTKPVTAAAIMMLVDQKKIGVDDPVSKYIPEFSKFPQVITVRHLLTHTSGLSEVTDKEGAAAKSLGDMVPAITSKPLKFAPGSKWSYCQSGMNMLGRIVEVASQETYEHFLRTHFFEPLGMKDTAFYLSEAQMKQWVHPVKREGDHFAETTISILYGQQPASRDRYAAPNAGIFTTASDYAKFAQLLLNRGMQGGKRYLSEAAVQTMTAVQTTPEMNVGFTPGMAYGFGTGVVRTPLDVTSMLSAGTYGHGGAYGTQAWIDPVKKRIYILMINRAGLENGDANPVRYAFQEAVSGQ